MRAVLAIFLKELADYALSPRVTFGILAACFAVLWVAGNLAVNDASYRVIVYGDADQIAAATESLSALSNIEPLDGASPLVDSREMRLKRADFAIAQRGGDWVVFHQAITEQQERGLALYASAMAYLLNGSDDPEVTTTSDKVLAGAKQAPVGVSRLGAFPGSVEIGIVPRTIALLTILISFIVAARSYSRDARSGILPLLFVARRANWTAVILAKLAVSVSLTALLLVLLLEGAYLIYGISVKPGFPQQIGIQMVAMVASASLGISAAILAKNETYLYILTGIYIILLIVLSGFLLPLDGAAPLVRWASYASPLTFSGDLLQEWSFYAIPPADMMRESLLVTAQALVAVLILGVSTALARRRA